MKMHQPKPEWADHYRYPRESYDTITPFSSVGCWGILKRFRDPIGDSQSRGATVQYQALEEKELLQPVVPRIHPSSAWKGAVLHPAILRILREQTPMESNSGWARGLYPGLCSIPGPSAVGFYLPLPPDFSA